MRLAAASETIDSILNSTPGPGHSATQKMGTGGAGWATVGDEGPLREYKGHQTCGAAHKFTVMEPLNSNLPSFLQPL